MWTSYFSFPKEPTADIIKLAGQVKTGPVGVLYSGWIYQTPRGTWKSKKDIPDELLDLDIEIFTFLNRGDWHAAKQSFEELKSLGPFFSG